jgi:hypothetical protein
VMSSAIRSAQLSRPGDGGPLTTITRADRAVMKPCRNCGLSASESTRENGIPGAVSSRSVATPTKPGAAGVSAVSRRWRSADVSVSGVNCVPSVGVVRSPYSSDRI